jgi:holliday junction DNA helicase RuvA
MIASLQGTLASVGPLSAVVEAGGIGYEVAIPVTTAERLPPPGQTVKLHTLAVYRQDAQSLYGFATPAERDFFRLLIEHVTGVGPKGALGIMSRLALPLLERAIREGDVATLARSPGIGRKTAERLVVELRSRLGAGEAGPAPGGGKPEPGARQDAVAALVALGYKAPDADEAVRRAVLALGPEASTEALVRRALA